MTPYPNWPSSRAGHYAIPDIQERILAALRDGERRGHFLSVRELQELTSASSTSVVMYHVKKLADDGKIVFGGSARAMRLTALGRGYPDDGELLAACYRLLQGQDGAIVAHLKARLGE